MSNAGIEKIVYKPDFVVPPGATLSDTLQTLNMSQVELARRMDRPQKTISEIVNGQVALTPETALQLETVLGISASFWNSLEKNYREHQARFQAEEALLNEQHLAKEFDYKKMSNFGWIPDTNKINERVENLLSFFRVTSLTNLPALEAIAYRKVANNGHSNENLVAWLRQGELEASKLDNLPFDKKKLKEALPKLRALTLEKDNIGEKIQEICTSCGVAVVFVAHLPRTYVIGATRNLANGTALIQMSVRGVFSDVFWFTFFHEIGHLILHKKRDKFINYEKSKGPSRSAEEKEADSFASEQLIPQAKIDDFIKNNEITRNSIVEFSERVGIAPGITLGRLQHMSILGYNQLVSLKGKFQIVPS